MELPDDELAPVIELPVLISLAGKDYFTQAEAAYYCCVSLSKFREVAGGYAIHPTKFGGKLVYRRADCQRAIEREFDRLERLPKRW